MLQNAFDLQDDVPGADLDPEWRALVDQQAHTLAVMLQRLQTTVAEVHHRPDGPRLQVLAADANAVSAGAGGYYTHEK